MGCARTYVASPDKKVGHVAQEYSPGYGYEEASKEVDLENGT